MKNITSYYDRMVRYGFTVAEADTLRKCERTLQRWAEGECGDSNNYASTHIERDETTGKTYRVIMPHASNERIRIRIQDRETGALNRIKAIMKSHPDCAWYHQSDPRGCMLYVIKRSDLNGCDIQSVYTRGVACV